MRRYLRANPGDGRQVVTDDAAGYFGARIDNGSLTPHGASRLGKTSLDAWLAKSGK